MFLNPPPPLPENISTPPEYNLNPSEKSQPLPKKSQPLSKKCQPPPPEKNVNSASLIIPNLTQKISTRTPKNCQPLPKKCHLYRKNLTPPDSTLSPEYFSSPPKISQTPRKFCNLPPKKISQPPPRKFLNPPPQKKFLNPPPPKISQPPTKITSYGKITGNNKKVIKLRRRCEDKASTHYLIWYLLEYSSDALLYITRNKYVGVWILHSHVNNENYTSLQDIELYREVHFSRRLSQKEW